MSHDDVVGAALAVGIALLLVLGAFVPGWSKKEYRPPKKIFLRDDHPVSRVCGAIGGVLLGLIGIVAIYFGTGELAALSVPTLLAIVIVILVLR